MGYKVRWLSKHEAGSQYNKKAGVQFDIGSLVWFFFFWEQTAVPGAWFARILSVLGRT